MNKPAKRVSLVIPTYGRPDDLSRLLDSLKAHKYLTKDWLEVIVVDNNPDKSARTAVNDACRKYKVKFAHEDTQGKAFAVNRGIRIASGEFIANTDDDTVVAQDDWLELMLAHFDEHPKLAYVSGNVVAMNLEDGVAGMWEKKGGLSKGLKPKYWSREFLESARFKYKPWQFKDMCAGANNMVRRSVLTQIGGYSILLEGVPPFQAGGTIEIGYRIARAGYELLYDPNARILHEHPTEGKELWHKMFAYGQGDTGYQMSNFLQYGDLRCLWWSLVGHSCYTISQKLVKRAFGKYPLATSYILAGLFGNIIGGPRFAWNYFLKGRKMMNHYKQVAGDM